MDCPFSATDTFVVGASEERVVETSYPSNWALRYENDGSSVDILHTQLGGIEDLRPPTDAHAFTWTRDSQASSIGLVDVPCFSGVLKSQVIKAS